MAPLSAYKLATRQVEKPWGRAVLPAPFRNPGSEKIGEIWFEAETGPALPLMIKYLFTSEKLSIQVHPSDAEAQAMGLASGKEECWLVLDAEPGACLGIGTLRPLGADDLRDAALSGEIEVLMDWKPVARGDFYYIPAGTVHAIGAGVSLIEVQQNADITYRLYDYGRPRELHLADGTAVAKAAPMSRDLCRQVDIAESALLLDSRHLVVAHLNANDLSPLADARDGAMIVPLSGTIAADGVTAQAGECLWAEDVATIEAGAGARFLAGWHKP